MNWLWEQPLFIVAIGFVTTALLGGMWLQTGQRPFVYGLCATVLLTCGLVLLERVVETDREQVETALQHLARAVERNDLEAVLRGLHSTEKRIRRRARQEMPKYDFHRVSIKQNLEITVEADQQPKRAKATFNVVVVVSDGSGSLNERPIPRFVTVHFEQEDGEWRVFDYRNQDPQVGFQRDR